MKRKLLFAAIISFFIAGLAAYGLCSSETTNLNLAKPSKGDRNWGQTINNNMDLLDAAYGFMATVPDDLPEVYIYNDTFNSTTGRTITLPKSVDSVNEYAVKITPTTRTDAIDDIYVTKTTTNFVVKCSAPNTTDTFCAAVYYIGDVTSYGGSIYRRWYVSPANTITDHANASTTGSIAWVAAQISTSPAIMELPGNKNYQIKNNLTIADNIQLFFQMGGIVDTDFSIRDSNYEWYQNGATSEYYLQASGGGNPNINMPSVAIENNAQMTDGSANSLAAGEWDWNDVNGLGYSTVYVRLSDSTDPDGKSADYVEAGYTLTINGMISAGLQQTFSGEGKVAAGAIAKVYPEWWGPNLTPGTTDMTVEIQAAIDSITAGEVCFNGETYLISSALVPESYVNLVGTGGTIIKLASASDVNMIDFTDVDTDVVIEGIEFDGNGSNQTRADTVNIICSTVAVKKLTINKCIFKNSAFDSIRIKAAGNEYIIITENKFYDYDATAVVLQYVTGGVIANNLFDNTDLTMTAGANAVSINYGDDISVTGNRINMSDTASAGSFGIDGTNVPGNITVTGNTIKCNEGAFNGGISLAHTSGLKNSTISGNSIYQAGYIAGIEVGGSSIAVTGNTVDGSANAIASIALNGVNFGISVTGNVISNYSGVGIDIQRSGTTFTDSYGITVSGNSLIDGTGINPCHSIYFNGSPARGLVVSGNTIINNENGYGIHGLTTSDTSRYMNGFSIIGNTIHNCLKGIAFGGTDNTNHTIIGNTEVDNAGEDIFEGTNYVIRDNTPDTEVLTGTVTLNRYMGAATIDASGGAVTGHLWAGYFVGQIKTIVMTDATASSTINISNHQTSDPEVATFDAVDETGVFMWTGSEWITLFATCTFEA